MVNRVVHLVMAARPNIMKVAPLYHALAGTAWAHPVLVHTGQHYDDNMSSVFVKTLDLPVPHHNLNIGSGSHAEQTGLTMIAYEALCHQKLPDLTIVVGDVNATIACALAAKKLGVMVGHLEAGLRSFDRNMPEEINRLAIDSICDWFWTPSPDATERLLLEGVDATRICEAGNVMIDAYCYLEQHIKEDPIKQIFNLEDNRYALITFHRPANVDDQEQLTKLVRVIENISRSIKLVFPLHPRTKRSLINFGLYEYISSFKDIVLCDPLPYIPFMKLMSDATLIITDSGGVQEESSYIGIPCLTLRANTERPITITHGTNQLVSTETVLEKVLSIINSSVLPKRPVITGWDGKAAVRIVEHIQKIFHDPNYNLSKKY